MALYSQSGYWVNMVRRFPIWSISLWLCPIMPCREYKRLWTDYEAALRRWGDVLLAQPVGRLVGDVKRALCEEKFNAAR